ncbi:GPI-Mannosyltransferase II co-activator [Teratosphaeria destructans]|uniref:GPI-Mannosyltransferase II co-activator n=1 Tax=Teratosphaeria destructans TaxID=418781 RepID=A0A9W7W6N9_9PEZI|nr:GPI-Mannosyltransferase II co-activator [Teratosphaeria destructans]
MNHMRILHSLACLFALLVLAAQANTEKAVFTAPPPTAFTEASLDHLSLHTFSPHRLSRRLSLPVAFPDEARPRGLDSWYTLERLTQGQRYEVRICWAAIQPTTFNIDTFTITHVFDTPDLIASLAEYSDRHIKEQGVGTGVVSRPPSAEDSVLFLRVQGAADYFTTNETLMQHPPPVIVDIILDPYLGNIFPASLVPTAFYLVALAAGGWYLSGIIWRHLVPPAKAHVD